MKTRTFTAAAALLALFLSAHTLLAQDRPAAPRPGEIRRPNVSFINDKYNTIYI